jgi:aspartyl-tRNA(Asn)/glutamyl-tRNA(Gln) amidotransferase subunit A
MSINPAHASVKELRAALAEKQLSREELVAWSHQAITKHDPYLGSVLELFDESSVLRGAPEGFLQGIPGIVKDNICMRDRIMSCGSRMLKNYRAPYDATAVTKLRAQGGLMLGRGNCDEFAMGSSNETSSYYPVRNPWDPTRVAGGSSGGPIAAVAAGFVSWALGSETGGSVRQPAAWCGIVGSKPTYGLVSRYGLTAYASSLDQIGVATRTVYDNALILSLIAGREKPIGNDSTAHELPVGYSLTQQLTGKIQPGLRVGILVQALQAHGVSSEVTCALETVGEELKKLGATLTAIELPSMELAAATYFVISRAEAASNLARFDGIRYGHRSQQAKTLEETYTLSRSEGFGDEVQRRILIGNYVLSHGHADAFYQRAQNAQARMRADCAAAFEKVDLILAPVTPSEAFKLGACSTNSLQLDLQDYFTCFANLVGMPAVSFPCGFTTSGMPIGVQLMGPHFSEALIMQTAYAYEQATPWHTMRPSLDNLHNFSRLY